MALPEQVRCRFMWGAASVSPRLYAFPWHAVGAIRRACATFMALGKEPCGRAVTAQGWLERVTGLHACSMLDRMSMGRPRRVGAINMLMGFESILLEQDALL